MNILLATPLYPPDIAEPAPYVKELARRLAKAHEVTILTYGHLPEQVPGVTVIAIDKRQPLFSRLWYYTLALRKATHTNDIVYAQNGPSVELPLLFVSGKKIVHIADARAHVYASKHFLYGMLEWFSSVRSIVVKEMPSQKPEILPLVPRPETALTTWEKEWEQHIDLLNTIFHAQ